MELSVREAGRRGGTRTKELYGPEFYRRLGRLGGGRPCGTGGVGSTTRRSAGRGAGRF